MVDSGCIVSSGELSSSVLATKVARCARVASEVHGGGKGSDGMKDAGAVIFAGGGEV